MLDGLSEFFNGLLTLLVICFVLAVLGVVYFCYSYFFKDHNTIKTKEKPTITWELESKGQTVDTVWIYKFKK